MRRTSAKGRAFIEREEGLVPYAYNDPAGHATFGVGHLLHLGPVTRIDQLKWGTKRFPRPKSLARLVFRRDLRKYEHAVRTSDGGEIRQHEFDACVSLAVNIGAAGFEGSTVARELRDGHKRGRGHGNYRAAADAFLLWDNPSILRPRRERERHLFLTGEYH